MPEFDTKDAEILAQYQASWNDREGPRVGDFVRMVDGELRRFTHEWNDGIQTTWKGQSGSFYLGNGYASYSGGLESAIARSKLRDTGETREGAFWFFHHNHARAHNGVYFKIPCRVFEVALTRDEWRKAREDAYAAGAYYMRVPDVTTGGWNKRAWCNWVHFKDEALNGFDNGED